LGVSRHSKINQESVLLSAKLAAEGMIMADLRITGVSNNQLELQAPDGSRHYLEISDDLLKAMKSRPTSLPKNLSVREIQTEIRLGTSIEELVARTGADEDHISKYAAPIITELNHIVTLARNIRLSLASDRFTDPNQIEFGTVMDDRLQLNKATNATWSSRKSVEGEWLVSVKFSLEGTSGTATITISTTSATFASKAVTFYSTSVDKYTVTRLAKVIGSASAATLVVTALDSTGNIIKEATNSTVYAYSDNLAAIATAATDASGAACSAYNDTLGGHVCSFSGAANGTANITIRNKSTLALSTKSSTAQAITVNLNPAVKVALSFDKATYAPGEVAYLSLSAVDAAGAAVGPNAGTNYLTAAGITGSAAFGNGSAGSESLTVTATPMNVAATGRVTDVALYTVKLYMPASGGTITASATGGTALTAANQVKVTASATVTDSGAAALAAVTALATTVASLKTLITTLTNLVLKIQKKVKA
jgi:hypothetical protein